MMGVLNSIPRRPNNNQHLHRATTQRQKRSTEGEKLVYLMLLTADLSPSFPPTAATALCSVFSLKYAWRGKLHLFIFPYRIFDFSWRIFFSVETSVLCLKKYIKRFDLSNDERVRISQVCISCPMEYNSDWMGEKKERRKTVHHRPTAFSWDFEFHRTNRAAVAANILISMYSSANTDEYGNSFAQLIGGRC